MQKYGKSLSLARIDIRGSVVVGNVPWSATWRGILFASPLETLRLTIIVCLSITLRCDASSEISKLIGKATRSIQLYSRVLCAAV